MRKRCLFFALAGVLSGIVNGLLGTGGGILTVFFLSKIYARENVYSTKDIFAITLSSSLIMSTASLFFYLSQGLLIFRRAHLICSPPSREAFSARFSLTD